jgi:DNA-directed RNA polymerase specialized sigma24 family protein
MSDQPQFRRTDYQPAEPAKSSSRTVLAAAIDKMPDPQRQLLRDRLIAEHSIEVVAFTMGLTVEDARMQFDEAAKALRVQLGVDAPSGDRKAW